MTTEYYLYDKTVKLTFSHGGHRYRVSFLEGNKWSQPRPTTGVTTILNVLNKGALVPWAARLAAEKYAKELKVHKGETITVALANELIDVSKNAHNEARDSAGDIGTNIHNLIEKFHTNEAFDEPEKMSDEYFALNAYREHWEESEFTPLMIEQPVYSRQYDFAGTLDQVVETPTGKKVLRDIKTTKVSKWAPNGAYVEMFAQLGGYAQCLNEMFGWLPDSLEITNVGKDGIIRRTTNDDFGMTVDDAIHYWNALYTAWYTNKDWEYKFKRS